jgi:hypothetical protein
MEMSCTETLAIEELRVGTDGQYIQPAYMDRGPLGVQVSPLPAGADVVFQYEGGVDVSLAGDAVAMQFFLLAAPPYAGRLSLEGPSGPLTWDFVEYQDIWFEGPPGDYTVAVTVASQGAVARVGGFIGSWSSIIRSADGEAAPPSPDRQGPAPLPAAEGR